MSVLTKVRLRRKGKAELGGSGGKDLDFTGADLLARKLRVTPLSKFVYFIDAELAHVAKVLGDVPEGVSQKIEEMWLELQWALLDEVGPWHEPADGLKTVNALLEAAAGGAALSENTVEDLKAIRRILLRAEKSNTPFRLSQA